MNSLRFHQPIRAFGIVMMLTILGGASTAAQESDDFRQTNGPAGGAFRNVIRAANGDLFAGHVYGTTYRSTDDGASWAPASNGLDAFRLYLLTPHVNGSLFAVTTNSGDQRIHDLHRSTDNGASWSNVLPDADFISAVATGPTDEVYVTTYDIYILRSLDNGESWDSVDVPHGAISLTTDSVGTLYILGVLPNRGGKQAYRSTDQGDSWETWGDVLPSEYRNVSEAKSFIALPSGDLYYGVLDSDGVLRLNAAAGTWGTANMGLPPNTSVFAIIAAGPDTIYAVGDGGVYRSIDGGVAWTRHGRYLGDLVNAITMTADGGLMIGAEAGMFRHRPSDDRWVPSSDGIYKQTILGLASGVDTTYGFVDRLYRTVDAGESWHEVPLPLQSGELPNAVAVGPDGERVVGVISYTNGPTGDFVWTQASIIRSTDGGESWTRSNAGLTATYVSSVRIHDGTLYAATDSGLFRSTDGGGSWRTGATGLPTTVVTTVAIAANGDLLVGTPSSGIWRSSDGGETWVESNQGNGNAGTQSIARTASGTILAVGGGNSSAYRSTDDGMSWTIMGGELPPVAHYWDLVATPRGALYISGNGPTGADIVWHSSDDGITWRAIDTLPSLPRSLSVDSAGYVYAGTQEHSAWRSISALSSVARPDAVRENALLLSVRGEREEPSACFRLPRASSVTLEIYDGGGRLMTIERLTLPAGSHVLPLTRSLSGGWYALRLASDMSDATVPFIITR